jgi:hypothetical protein
MANHLPSPLLLWPLKHAQLVPGRSYRSEPPVIHEAAEVAASSISWAVSFGCDM